MPRSFQIVEYKVAETNFFLEKLEECTYGLMLFEARNYLSAFLSASRSITFAIQASMSGIEYFENWYTGHQENMRHNKLAKYFLEARNSSQKVGYYPIVNGEIYYDHDKVRRTKYLFDRYDENLGKLVPNDEVISACTSYFKVLLELVFDCYQKFGKIMDPEQYFSFENLKKSGKTIEDLEEELGYPRGWTWMENSTDDERLMAIRDEIKYNGIDHILIKHLGKNRFGTIMESE